MTFLSLVRGLKKKKESTLMSLVALWSIMLQTYIQFQLQTALIWIILVPNDRLHSLPPSNEPGVDLTPEYSFKITYLLLLFALDTEEMEDLICGPLCFFFFLFLDICIFTLFRPMIRIHPKGLHPVCSSEVIQEVFLE